MKRFAILAAGIGVLLIGSSAFAGNWIVGVRFGDVGVRFGRGSRRVYREESRCERNRRAELIRKHYEIGRRMGYLDGIHHGVPGYRRHRLPRGGGIIGLHLRAGYREGYREGLRRRARPCRARRHWHSSRYRWEW